MTVTSDATNGRSGQFVYCVKIHEDELQLVEPRITRAKPNGFTEEVNRYEVFGKQRPALILREVKGYGGYIVVWYTYTSFRDESLGIEVTTITNPEPPKRAFLKPQPHYLRCVPPTDTWFGAPVCTLEKTIFDSFLKQAQKIPSLRR